MENSSIHSTRDGLCPLDSLTNMPPLYQLTISPGQFTPDHLKTLSGTVKVGKGR